MKRFLIVSIVLMYCFNLASQNQNSTNNKQDTIELRAISISNLSIETERIKQEIKNYQSIVVPDPEVLLIDSIMREQLTYIESKKALATTDSITLNNACKKTLQN